MTGTDSSTPDETPTQEVKPKKPRSEEQIRTLEMARQKALEKRKEMKELRDAEKALEKQEKDEALAARKKRVEEGLAKKPKTPTPEHSEEDEANRRKRLSWWKRRRRQSRNPSRSVSRRSCT